MAILHLKNERILLSFLVVLLFLSVIFFLTINRNKNNIDLTDSYTDAPSKVDYPPSGDIDFERMVRVNDKVFNVFITSTPSAPPENSYCGGGLERYIYIFNEQKNKLLFFKNIDSCLENIYLSDLSLDRMFQGNSIVFRWDAINEKYNVKGVIDLSIDPINYSETNIIVGKQSTASTTLESKRTFIFENFTYDFLNDSCEVKASPIEIIYHDKNRKRLFIYFDCSHGATGNTSDAIYAIDLNSHRAKEITQKYLGRVVNDDVGVSPDNKYLTLDNFGNSGWCGIYSTIGLVDLEKSTVLDINPPSADYSYLNSDTVVVSVLDSLPDNKTSVAWDKENNLLFVREIKGCSSATAEFDGGFYTIFTEKWSYSPDKNTYTLIEKIKN